MPTYCAASNPPVTEKTELIGIGGAAGIDGEERDDFAGEQRARVIDDRNRRPRPSRR